MTLIIWLSEQIMNRILKKIRETTGWPMNMESDAEITKLRKLGVAGKGGKLRVSPSYGVFAMVFKVITLPSLCQEKIRWS